MILITGKKPQAAEKCQKVGELVVLNQIIL